MATKQGLYTAALKAIGERKTLVTENVKARRELDDIYDGVLEECLAAGSWNFAMETVQQTGDTGASRGFGYAYAYTKPADCLRTWRISDNEYFNEPLIAYDDDGLKYFADVTPVYLRYVSNDTGLGLDLTRWTAKFTRYVELELASRVCFALTGDPKLTESLIAMADRARRLAKNHDAMDEAQPKFKPEGAWTRSRYGNSRRDRGKRNNLTG